MKPSIRPIIFPADYEKVLRLWENCGEGISLGASDEPGEIAKKLERDPDLALIIEVDGDLAGAVLGGFDGRRGMVYHLAVDPKYRELGLGSQLMEELENRLRAKRCLKVYLLVKKGNLQAQSFYGKRDWEEMKQVSIFAKKLS